MTEPRLIIAFGEGKVEPLGRYGFTVNLDAHSGCDVIEQMLFLIRSLKSPYQLLADAVPVEPDEVGRSHTRITVWTQDRANADFLLLMSELGVPVSRVVEQTRR